VASMRNLGIEIGQTVRSMRKEPRGRDLRRRVPSRLHGLAFARPEEGPWEGRFPNSSLYERRFKANTLDQLVPSLSLFRALSGSSGPKAMCCLRDV